MSVALGPAPVDGRSLLGAGENRFAAALAAPAIVLAGSLYPPVFGLGTEAEPSVAAQGMLIIVSLALGALALTDAATRAVLRSLPVGLLLVSTGWMALTALLGTTPLDGAVRGAWFGAAAAVVVWTTARHGFERAVLLIASTAGILTLIGVAANPVLPTEVQAILPEEPLFPWPRLRGVTANQTIIGFGGGTLVALSAFAVRKVAAPPVVAFLALTGVIGAFASHGRAALGALAIGAVFGVARSRLWQVLLLAALVMAGAAFVVSDQASSVVERQRQEEFVDYWSTGGGIFTGRPDVWADAAELGLRSPFLGTGNGTFQTESAERFESRLRSWDPTHAHNIVLEIFADQGLIGLAIAGGAVIALWRRRHRLPDGALALLVAIAAHSAIESIFYAGPTPRWLLLVAVVAAVSDGLHRRQDAPALVTNHAALPTAAAESTPGVSTAAATAEHPVIDVRDHVGPPPISARRGDPRRRDH